MPTPKASLMWAVPIVIYLITQSSVAIWWASSQSSSLLTVHKEISEFITESNAENLRQWARINDNEDAVDQVNNGIGITNANLDNLKENIERVELQSIETNRLLRELLSTVGSNSDL